MHDRDVHIRISESDVMALSAESDRISELGIALYKTVGDVFTNLNRLSVKKRTHKSMRPSIYPAYEYFVKTDSKFPKKPTVVIFSLGSQNKMGFNPDSLEDFEIRVKTGEINYDDTHTRDFTLKYGLDDGDISIGIGKPLMGSSDVTTPTALEIILNDKGQVKIGSKTNPQLLEGQNVSDILGIICLLTMEFTPKIAAGFVRQKKSLISLNEPKEIQEALQIIEDMYEKEPYDSITQLLEMLGNYQFLINDSS